MALYDIPFTPQDLADLQRATEASDMDVADFIRWAVVLRIAEVLGAENEGLPIADHDLYGKNTHANHG